MYFSAPPPPDSEGSRTALRVHTTADVQKAIEEEEEESEGFSSFSSSDSEAAEKFVVKPHPSNKAGSSSKTSKRGAEDDLEAGLAPLPKRKRIVDVKRVVKKLPTADEVPPPVITFEEGQDSENRVLISCFPYHHVCLVMTLEDCK